MFTKLLLLNCLALSWLFADTADATSCWWNGTVNTDWNNQANYNVPLNPSEPDTTTAINWGKSGYSPSNRVMTLNAGQTGYCSSMWSYAELGGTYEAILQINAGHVISSQTLTIGTWHNNCHSTVNVVDGIVDFPEYIRVGRTLGSTEGGNCKLHVTGGTINTGWLDVAYDWPGTVLLYGGTINAGALTVKEGGLVDITNGSLVLNSNIVGTVESYIDNGWIVAYGGIDPHAVVKAEYDTPTNKTIVTAAIVELFKAYSPSHTDNVQPAEKILTWTPGDYAEKHTVYFGTSLADVNETAIPVSFQQDANSFGPVELGTGRSYFWRVDEVNLSEPNTWTGDIWSFTVDSFLLIDDMESYSVDANRIFNTWLCGWWDLTSGSLVIEELSDPDRIYSGAKSMELKYDNTGKGTGVPYYSEIKRQYTSAQNWSMDGQLKAISLWFKGRADNNSLNAQLYVALSDDDSTSVKFHPDANAVKFTDWQQWNIALDDFSSVEQENIRTVYIGFGDRDSHPDPGGKGTVHFDDIIVYPTRCITEQEYDLNADCVVNFQDLAIFADGWLNKEIWY